ncbi:MAG TPA: ribbon-helix-helix protein, CopG family [Acidobacteriaceae bacterium]|nr:ribbon-helix-helix protein, CopG family [Acidobacteriaceae bacterium]
MPPVAVTSLKLDTETKARVQRLAAARRRTPHWILREAVEQYVEREEAREQLRHDALKAWTHYRVTGLHATAGEADKWLAELEAGKRSAPPKCHTWSGRRRPFRTLPVSTHSLCRTTLRPHVARWPPSARG